HLAAIHIHFALCERQYRDWQITSIFLRSGCGFLIIQPHRVVFESAARERELEYGFPFCLPYIVSCRNGGESQSFGGSESAVVIKIHVEISFPFGRFYQKQIRRVLANRL